MRSLTRTIFAAALAFAVTAPQAMASAIAQIKAAEGEVEVLRNGRWRRAREGTELTIKDSVRTGAEGLAQIEFYDADAEGGARATTIDMVPESEVSIEHFEISKSLPRQRQGFIDVAKGYLRAFTKGWSVGSIFSVKAGSTVCGIRGSIADIGFNPLTGQATFTSLDGQMFTFQVEGLPANYFQMKPGEQKQAMREALTRAISKALEIGTYLAATGQLPPGSGATELPVGEQRTAVVGDINYRSVQLSPQMVQKLNSISVAKAEEEGTTGQVSETVSGNTNSGIDEALTKGDTVSSKLLEAITQELVSSPELNTPVSNQ